MCRSIQKLRRPEEPASEEEIQAAALQFVRKVSGYRKPSRANQLAFDDAVMEVAAATQKLLDRLMTREAGGRTTRLSGSMSLDEFFRIGVILLDLA